MALYLRSSSVSADATRRRVSTSEGLKIFSCHATTRSKCMGPSVTRWIAATSSAPAFTIGHRAGARIERRRRRTFGARRSARPAPGSI